MITEAVWDIRLDVECPNCERLFDVLSLDDAGGILQGVETGQSDAELEIECPGCLTEFTCKTVF